MYLKMYNYEENKAPKGFVVNKDSQLYWKNAENVSENASKTVKKRPKNGPKML